MACEHVPPGRMDPVNGVQLRDKSKGSIRARLLAQSYTPSSSEHSPQSQVSGECSDSRETIGLPPMWTCSQNNNANSGTTMGGSVRSKSEPVKMPTPVWAVPNSNVSNNCSVVKNIHMPDKSIMQIRGGPSYGPHSARNASPSSPNVVDIVEHNFSRGHLHHYLVNGNFNDANTSQCLTTANGHVRYRSDEDVGRQCHNIHNLPNRTGNANRNCFSVSNINQSVNQTRNLRQPDAFFAKPVFTTQEAGAAIFPSSTAMDQLDIDQLHQQSFASNSMTTIADVNPSASVESMAKRMKAGVSSNDDLSEMEFRGRTDQASNEPLEKQYFAGPDLDVKRIAPPSYGSVIVQIRQIYAALASLAGMGFFASVLGVISMQMLFSLRAYATNQLILDIATCFSSIALTFSLVSALTSFLQLFLSCKLLKLSTASGIRILLYLREGLYLRFVSFSGLFLSVPMLLIAIICYVSMSTGLVATVISAICASFGCIVCVLTLGHSAYAWLGGSLKLDPAEMVQPRSKHDLLVIDAKYSTLV